MPDEHAIEHAARCHAMLAGEIRANGGWLSFAQFMDRALYAPGLGYYAAGARKFGSAGDFVTAPEISALFGECLARSIEPTLKATRGSVLELGPGSGKLAVDMLQALDKMGTLPKKYLLLEVSADLRQRQQQRLAELPPHLFARCEWLSALPDSFTGAIVANEVLDVVPVHLVSFQSGSVVERGVELQDDRFVWQDVAELPTDVQTMVEAVQRDVFEGQSPQGYLSEVSPQAAALSRAVATTLQAGVVLWIDYGFRRAEFYHPSRTTGTLMCHYRHHAHTDPFLYPGLQDITAHVDFTSVAEAAFNAGAELAGYTTQANFLLGAGLPDLVSRYDPNDVARYLGITNQVQRLVSPAEMGEFFKVIGFAKGGHGIEAFQACRPLPL